MSESDSGVRAVLENAPRLEKAYGRFLGAVLTRRALSAIKPRRSIKAVFLSILSAAAGLWWR